VQRHVSPVARLRAVLDELAERVEEVSFELPSTDRDRRIELRDDLTLSIRTYLIPRLADLDGDVVAVVVGATGSGKSTIVNTLAGRNITETGAVRPTTTAPVVWCHAENADEYREGPFAAVSPRVVTGHEGLLRGATIVDAPDFDSVVTEHREIAERLLEIADLCVFVTSAQRYADAVPWEFLKRAHQRGVPTVFVINRLPAGGEGVVGDFKRHLRERAVAHREVVEIEEQAVVDGQLPASTVEPVKSLLEQLSDPVRRHEVLIDATRGSIEDVVVRSEQLADETRHDMNEADALADIAFDMYADQYRQVVRSLEDGTLIRAEVAARWQKFLGTGRFLTALSERLGSFGRSLSGKPKQIDADARRAFALELRRHLDAAAARAASAWELDPAGKTLIANSLLWRSSPDLDDRLDTMLDEWIIDIGTLVTEQGQDRKRKAQLSSLGVNAAAVVAMVVIFAQTGGLTGGELGVAAGAAALQQKLLEQVFGTAVVRSMVTTARTSLEQRMHDVFDAESARFTGKVRGLAARLDPRLDEAARAVGAAAEVFYGR
jgi:energy-coupling factor transporter ATP-binding protein EcfA2